MVFLLTGLQARALIATAKNFPIYDLLIATAVVTLIVIAARFVCDRSAGSTSPSAVCWR